MSTQYVPTIVVNSDGTEVIENIPCGTLKSTKFTSVKEDSGDSHKSEKQAPKKFIPKFKK